MKRKDLTVILIVVFVSGLFSYIVSNKFIATPKNREQNVEAIVKISPDFIVPIQANFNSNSINLTQLIEIGPNANNQPFTNQ